MPDIFVAVVVTLGTLGVGLSAPLWWNFAASHFVGGPVAALAQAIRNTRSDEWRGDRFTVYCKRLDITLWIANSGYAFRVWCGEHHGSWDTGYVLKGGPSGELLWRAWKSVGLQPGLRRLHEHLASR